MRQFAHPQNVGASAQVGVGKGLARFYARVEVEHALANFIQIDFHARRGIIRQRPQADGVAHEGEPGIRPLTDEVPRAGRGMRRGHPATTQIHARAIRHQLDRFKAPGGCSHPIPDLQVI